jgi:WD40 repeat protein/serine/threonine protein kinase
MTDESLKTRNDSSESSGGTSQSPTQVAGEDSYDKNHADTCDLAANPAPDQRRIGKYRLQGEIGRGGMGVVYAASDEQLKRTIALRVLPPSSQLDPVHLKRFLNESQAAAQLNHANIVPVYEVGEIDGTNYYSMQLINGENLGTIVRGIRSALENRSVGPSAETTKAAHRSTAAGGRKSESEASDGHGDSSGSLKGLLASAFRLSADSGHVDSSGELSRAVAHIGATIAEALHHAHDIGIIHRDIKPANLLLDESGKVWVTDFGLAQISSGPALTETGVLLGTLRYMSPEQASGHRSFVDHRTDIYSLGATLYELLTLRRAITGKRTEDILRQIAFERPVSIRRINRSVSEDLETIIGKAMAHSPMDRYASADELAQDLKCFLNGEPISAKRPTVRQRFQAWRNRHPRTMTAVVLVAFALFNTSIAAAGLVWNALQVETEQLERTAQALTESEGLRLLANANLQLTDNPGLALTLAVQGARGAPGLEARSTLQAAMDANHEYATHSEGGRIGNDVVVSPDGKTAVTCVYAGQFGQGSFPARVHSMTDGSTLFELDCGDCITSAAFGPAGRFVITSSAPLERIAATAEAPLSRPPVLWDASTGRKLQTFHNETLFRAVPGVFHPDGSQIVLTDGDEAVIYSLAESRPDVFLRGHAERVTYAEFSPDGERVLTVSEDRTIRVWDAVQGTELRSPIPWNHANSLMVRAAFTAASDRVIIRDKDTAALHQAVAIEGQDVVTPHVRTEFNFVASRAAHFIAMYDLFSTEVAIVSSRNMEMICHHEVPSRIREVHVHPTKPQVLVVCGPQMFLFNSETGTQICELSGHMRDVTGAFLGGTDVIASVSNDATLRLWHTYSGRNRRSLQADLSEDSGERLGLLASVSHDDRLIVAPSSRVFVTRLWNTDGSRLPGTFKGAISEGRCDSEKFVTCLGRTIYVNQGSTSREVYRGGFPDVVSVDSRLVASGRKLFVRTRGQLAFLVDLRTNARMPVTEPGETIRAFAVTPDGSRVLVGTSNGRCFALDTESGQEVWNSQQEFPAADIDITRDGSRFLIVDGRGRISLGTIDGDIPAPLSKPVVERESQARFLSDGARIVTWHNSRNKSIRCWDATTGDLVSELSVSGRVDLSCHAEKPLVVVASDHGARLWYVESGETTEVTEAPCRSISCIHDHVAVLLTGFARPGPGPGSVGTSEFWVWSIESEKAIHKENLGLASHSVRGDVEKSVFVVTERAYATDVFELESGSYRFRGGLHPSHVVMASFSQQPMRLVTVSENGTIHTTDDTGQPLHSAKAGGDSTVTTAVLSPEGHLLVTGTSDGELVVWTVADCVEVNRLQGHESAVRSIRFDESGHYLVSTAEKDSVHLWDLRTSKAKKFTVEEALHAELSPDGRFVLVIAGRLTSAKRKAWLIDVATEQTTDMTQGRGTQTAVFSPTGSQFGLLSTDGILQVFRLEDRQLQHTIPKSLQRAFRFAFSPDGTEIVTDYSSRLSCWNLMSGLKSLSIRTGDDRRSRVSELNKRWYPYTNDGRQLIISDSDVRKWSRNPSVRAEQHVPRQLTEDERRQFRLELADIRRAND